MDEEEGIAAAFISGIGTLISAEVPGVIKLMKKKSPTQKEKAELFHLLLNGTLHPEISNYLIQEYTGRNLAFPIPVSMIKGENYIDFFMRFMNPQVYTEAIPNLRYQPEQMG